MVIPGIVHVLTRRERASAGWLGSSMPCNSMLVVQSTSIQVSSLSTDWACGDRPSDHNGAVTGSARPGLRVASFSCSSPTSGTVRRNPYRRMTCTSGRLRTASESGQRTLNPRVRGSSPWRRTRPDLVFLPSLAPLDRPLRAGGCSMAARLHGSCTRGGVAVVRELPLAGCRRRLGTRHTIPPVIIRAVGIRPASAGNLVEQAAGLPVAERPIGVRPQVPVVGQPGEPVTVIGVGDEDLDVGVVAGGGVEPLDHALA